MDTKPKRRWFRFSLRTLLVLVTVASAGIGWLGLKWREAKAQRDAVLAIYKIGGIVRYSYEGPIDDPNLSAVPSEPEWLRKLLGDDFFHTVTGVRLQGAQIPEHGLEQLHGLKHVQVIDLADSTITDSQLVDLRRLVTLRQLNLSYTRVTNAGLTNLRELSQLEYLGLGETEISDEGLTHLRGLVNLKELALFQTHVTPQGCKELREFIPGLMTQRSYEY